MKKTMTLIFALFVMLGIPCSASAVFAVSPAGFADVPSGAWYAADVNKAVGLGLVNGKSDTTYCPDDNLTYAETVKLAACMHQKSTTGNVTLQPGKPWYQNFVNYCKTYSIITADYDWNQKATRAGYMEIFAKALPDTAFNAINEVPDGSIPDVPMTHPQANAIYKLYRAGIVRGVDDKFTCNPGSNIKRSEVAVILVRMMDATLRGKFSTVGADANAGKVKITLQPKQIELALNNTGSISVTAGEGPAPYTYKWEYEDKDGKWAAFVNDKFATVEKETVKFTLADEKAWITVYKVRCTVTDAKGNTAVTDPIVPVKVAVPVAELKISKQPQPIELKKDEKGSISAEVTGGTAPYTYVWEYESLVDGTWTPLKGDESGVVMKNGTMEFTVNEDEPWYLHLSMRCTITDAKKNKVSTKPITPVKIKAETPAAGKLQITKQPVGPVFRDGETAAITVEASGGKQPYTYRWEQYYQGSTWITLKTGEDAYTPDGNTFTINSIEKWMLMDGIRCCVVDADSNEVYSDSVVVTLEDPSSPSSGDGDPAISPLKIEKNPVGANNLVAGSDHTFTAIVQGGTMPYTYEWYINYGDEDVKIVEDTDSMHYFHNYGTRSLTVVRIIKDFSVYCRITDSSDTQQSIETERVYVTIGQGVG